MSSFIDLTGEKAVEVTSSGSSSSSKPPAKKRKIVTATEANKAKKAEAKPNEEWAEGLRQAEETFSNQKAFNEWLLRGRELFMDLAKNQLVPSLGYDGPFGPLQSLDTLAKGNHRPNLEDDLSSCIDCLDDVWDEEAISMVLDPADGSAFQMHVLDQFSRLMMVVQDDLRDLLEKELEKVEEDEDEEDDEEEEDEEDDEEEEEEDDE